MPEFRDTCRVRCFDTKVVERLRRILPADDDLEEARIRFSALADPARIKLLVALRGGEELCVCDVAQLLGIQFAAASHHLRKLRDLRILRLRNNGKMAYYSLRDPLVGELAALALGVRRGKQRAAKPSQRRDS